MAEQRSNRESKSLPPPPIPPMNLPVDKDGNIIREVIGREDRSVPPEQLEGGPDSTTASAMKALGMKGASKEIDPEDDDGQTPIPLDRGVLVKAVREGFFRNQRMLPGDFFAIPNMDAWGDWMALADDKAEADRQAKLKSDKAAERKKAKEDAEK